MDLTNKVAIVTGSSRGIGKATVELLAERGARVVINYKSDEVSAKAVLKSVGAKNALLVQADVTKEDDVSNLVAATIQKFGTIDILVNNAGEILRPGDWQSDLETWQATLDVNLTSAWLMSKAVAPIMSKKRAGAIVNVTSVYGFLGAAPVLAYTVAKGGLITLTKALAKEFAPHIRVNAVAPSNVMTDMTKGAGEELIELFRQQTPIKRIAEPAELAKTIVFLASDEASYTTGEMVVVDGGYSLK